MKFSGSPDDYLRTVLGKWISKSIANGFFVIVGGDFNGVMDTLGNGKQPYIRPWIEDLGMQAPLTDKLLPQCPSYQTHYSGTDRNPSRIDHVFHSRSTNGIICSEAGTCDDSSLELFDHRPVWIGIKLPRGIQTAGRGKHLQRPPMLTIKIKDNQKQVDAYNLLLAEFRENHPLPPDLQNSIDDVPGLLGAAHLETLKAVKSVTGDNKQRIHAKCKETRSTHKDGYSPSARLIQDALQCMVEILRKAFTRNKHRRWTAEGFKDMIRPLVSQWKTRAAKCFPDTDIVTLGLGLSCPTTLLTTPFSRDTRTQLNKSIRAGAQIPPTW
jgi:hypothetical protein